MSAGEPSGHGIAGDDLDVVDGLDREIAATRDEARHAILAAIVGGCGQSEIAELVSEEREIACREPQLFGGIVRIGQPLQSAGLGHELRDALGAGVTDRVGVEVALLPDQPCEIRQAADATPRRRARLQCRHPRYSFGAGCNSTAVGRRRVPDQSNTTPRPVPEQQCCSRPSNCRRSGRIRQSALGSDEASPL